MTDAEFEFLSVLVRDRSGIVIGRDKTYLLDNRLTPIATKRGLGGLSGLVGALRGARDEQLASEVVEAMTTNETLFFRDSRPFETLRCDLLRVLMAARAQQRTLRIWSAACSTGQEPYSIAMLLKEEGAKLAGWTVQIVATDIATSVLAKAKSGVYSQFEVQRGLPIKLLVKYFKQVGTHWEIDPQLRSMIDFRTHNIVSDAPPQRSFDVIFCRNLLIYFNQDLKRRVLDKLAGALATDGALFLGGAESVLGLSEQLEPVPEQRGSYRLVRGGSTPARLAAAGGLR